MLSSISKTLRGTAIGIAALLVTSAPASAVVIGVTYAMTYSFVAPAVGQPTIYGPGSLTMWFANGTSGGHVGPGSIPWISGTGMFMQTFSIGGSLIHITGFQNVVFGGGMGAVTAGGLFNIATVGHIASGMLHCTGFFCGAGGFSPSVPVNLTSGPQKVVINGLLLNGFPSVGPQNFGPGPGLGSMTPQGGTLQITVTGQEVSRQAVPEPGTGGLLGLGLAGLGIVVTTLRRVRS